MMLQNNFGTGNIRLIFLGTGAYTESDKSLCLKIYGLYVPHETTAAAVSRVPYRVFKNIST